MMMLLHYTKLKICANQSLKYQVLRFNKRAYIHTTISALELLNLTNKPNYTSFEVRDAYFNAAKKCHPDSSFQKQNLDSINIYDLTSKFMQLTDAYEYLQKSK